MSDSKSRAKTADELRDEFMDACRSVADYWATVPLEGDRDSVHSRIAGALHSWLSIIDGVSGEFSQALKLVADPHPDDKAFLQSEGENWAEPGTEITEGYLHDLLYYGTWVKYRGPHFKEGP